RARRTRWRPTSGRRRAPRIGHRIAMPPAASAPSRHLPPLRAPAAAPGDHARVPQVMAWITSVQRIAGAMAKVRAPSGGAGSLLINPGLNLLRSIFGCVLDPCQRKPVILFHDLQTGA